MVDTVLTDRCVVSKKEFDKYLLKKLTPLVGEYIKEFNVLMGEIRNIYNYGQQIKVYSLTRQSDSFYIDCYTKCAVPNFDIYEMISIDNVLDYDYDTFLSNNTVLPGLISELPTLSQLRKMAKVLKDYFDDNTYFVCVCDDEKYPMNKDLECAYNPYTGKITITPASVMNMDILAFPICNLTFTNRFELLLDIWLSFGLCPAGGLSARGKELFYDLFLLKRDCDSYVKYNGGEQILIVGYKLLEDLFDNPQKDIFRKLHWQVYDTLKKYYEIRFIGEEEMALDLSALKLKNDILLDCEKIRADIEPYEERILTDPNRGHWDLWREQSNTSYTVQLENQYVARNPICDINENGVIAIDFGTKSTIVVYQSDINHSLPMGIGDGNLSKAPTERRYENPTVMHFVNLDQFLSDYNDKKGRPNTKWNDLTISHTAMEQFSLSSSEEYYEYLHQIKQWAGQREKQFRIKPHEGDSIVLPAFLDLEEDDLNPIELYAYYIGLYINNMRKGHGIFLDYYLSFPVTYEVKIREKIVESFEKGLKKSLPETILNNQEIMDKFHVNGDISEPEAYAVCALQEYGFDPQEDEEVFYGIFDFGGGTTDFDFGLWKQSSKRKYDYTIENFGAGGDEFLGGENLLEMLAFEVFKKNRDFMREKGYTFTLAPKCKEFLGSDVLLSDSQEAEKNMHNLMEVLRPYWEKQEDNEKFSEEDAWFDKYIDMILSRCSKSAYLDNIEKRLDQIEDDYYDYKVDLNEAMNKIAEMMVEYEIDISTISPAINNNSIVVTLFDKNGKDHANESLQFSVTEIDKFIEDKIREGVKNFFSALLLSYQNEKVKKPTVVNIFLAGNSCKSPVVRRVFEEEIEKVQNEIKEQYNIEGNVGKLFEVFPPLGTLEAYKKMEELKIDYEKDNFEKPTGKTGVAFGLLQCRKGGKIERVSNTNKDTEIPFQFFIGWVSKKKFVLFRDDSKVTKYKGKPDYNTWYKFIEADDDVFELNYTTLPECVNGDLLAVGNAAVKMIRCTVDVVDENAYVYIRAVDPHTIEYVVAENDDVENSMLGEISRKELR